MRRWMSAALVVAIGASGAGAARAQPLDAGAAREQLKQGFELKREGKYAEALPHLLESLRLDPQLKTLLNLADCEEHVAKLVDADRHWVQARDRAAQDGNAAIRAEAERRLEALEKRIPRVVVRLSSGAPADTEVSRDGVVLGAVSLGTALPTDPGKHVVVVRAKGRADASFEVSVGEGEKKELEVAAGEKTPEPVVTPTPTAVTTSPPPPPVATPRDPTQPPDTGGGSGMRTAGVVVGVVGVVGLGVGAFFGVQALSKKSDAESSGCVGVVCPSGAAATRDDAKKAGNVSTIFFVAGGALAAAGLTLWLVAPKSGGRSVGWIQAAPSVGLGGAGLTVRGAF